MGRCNFCNLTDIKRRAKEKGDVVTILNDALWGMGGKNVYVHPKNVIIRKLEGGEDGVRSSYRVSWMMEIPKSCEC